MYKIIFFLIIYFQISNLSFSQNLIPNGDFEGPGADTSNCMNYLRSIGWNTAIFYSVPLIFTKNCDDHTRKADKNVFGNQKPEKGEVYIGLHANDNLFTKLNKPLEAGKDYCFSMYVSMAERHASKGEIGARFSNKTLYEKNVKVSSIAYFKPNFDTLLQKTDTAEWIRICGTYHAKGWEKYIFIGNFKSVYVNKEETFIFVDNISLTPKKNNNCCPEEATFKKGNTILLKNLLFKLGSSKIESSSFPELNKLVIFLKNNPDIKIKIDGYTDNTGNDKNNRILSSERAKSVYNYLVKKGISYTRISSEGHGSKLNKYPNDTPENKAKNRRVEISFY